MPTKITAEQKNALLARGYSVTCGHDHVDDTEYVVYYTWTHRNGSRLLGVGGKFKTRDLAWSDAFESDEDKITTRPLPGTKMPEWKVLLIEAKRTADKSPKINRAVDYGRIVDEHWEAIMNTRQLTTTQPTKGEKK